MKKTTDKAKAKPAVKAEPAPAKPAAKAAKVIASNYDPMHALLRGVHAHKVIR